MNVIAQPSELIHFLHNSESVYGLMHVMNFKSWKHSDGSWILKVKCDESLKSQISLPEGAYWMEKNFDACLYRTMFLPSLKDVQTLEDQLSPTQSRLYFPVLEKGGAKMCIVPGAINISYDMAKWKDPSLNFVEESETLLEIESFTVRVYNFPSIKDMMSWASVKRPEGVNATLDVMWIK